jgi:hypothetical protein
MVRGLVWVTFLVMTFPDTSYMYMAGMTLSSWKINL